MAEENRQPILEVQDLGIDFGGLTAVNNLNMKIYPEQIDGLIGDPEALWNAIEPAVRNRTEQEKQPCLIC